MEKDIRDFRPGESLQVNGQKYVFLERESRPGKLYIQEGGQAHVLKVKDLSNNIYALKIFKAKYRKEEILERGLYLRNYCHLPGMQAADNQIIDPSASEFRDTIKQYPFLQYAIIMPWLPQKAGSTWSALRSKQSQTKFQLPDRVRSQKRATKLAKVLNELSNQSIAHCDLCPNNLIIDEADNVYLIDLENYYHKSFSPPPWGYPGGQPGYRHSSIDDLKKKQYHRFGDAFAGALLITELLVWHDPDVRSISLDEMLFRQNEIQARTDSYRVIKQSIRDISADCEKLFTGAWNSKKLEDCPTMSEWLSTLENIKQGKESRVSTTNVHTVTRRRVAHASVSTAKDTPREITTPRRTASPHVNRRVSATQRDRHSRAKSGTSHVSSQQSNNQKPIIRTTRTSQSNSTNWFTVLGIIVVIIAVAMCVALAAVWLSNL